MRNNLDKAYYMSLIMFHLFFVDTKKELLHTLAPPALDTQEAIDTHNHRPEHLSITLQQPLNDTIYYLGEEQAYQQALEKFDQQMDLYKQTLQIYEIYMRWYDEAIAYLTSPKWRVGYYKGYEKSVYIGTEIIPPEEMDPTSMVIINTPTHPLGTWVLSYFDDFMRGNERTVFPINIRYGPDSWKPPNYLRLLAMKGVVPLKWFIKTQHVDKKTRVEKYGEKRGRNKNRNYTVYVPVYELKPPPTKPVFQNTKRPVRA